MKEFKYTIDGKEYKVQIDAVEGNIASVNVNGEAYKVEMEQKITLYSSLCSYSSIEKGRKQLTACDL